MINRIRKVIEALGYSDKDHIRVHVRRLEPVNKLFTNIKGLKNEEIEDMFMGFNRRYGLKVKGDKFPVSMGGLSIKEFFSFLEEYDEKYGLKYTEIDFKEMVLRPAYI